MRKYPFNHPQFIKSATHVSHYPKLLNKHGDPMEEIAVAGRSNVGKSSLLNYLFKRKDLVKTSSTPGKTREINFFTVDEALGVVDLPGYGYAKVSKSQKEQWGPMIHTYLNQRQHLKIVLLLFDIRRLPNEDDRQMMDWIVAKEMAAILVLTKIDKISKNDLHANTKKILQLFDYENLHYVHTSAVKKVGKEQLLKLINEALGDEKDDEASKEESREEEEPIE